MGKTGNRGERRNNSKGNVMAEKAEIKKAIEKTGTGQRL